MSEEPSTPALFKLLAPFLLLTLAVTVLVVLALFRLTPLGSTLAVPAVASFDVLKYTNAQRAVASSFLKRDPDSSSTSQLLLDLPERTRQAISEVAGAGTLVVVKQAVVQGQTRDVTDEVLTRLGLPTNVPTADATAYVMGAAPTSLTLAMPVPQARTETPTSAPQVLP